MKQIADEVQIRRKVKKYQEYYKWISIADSKLEIVNVINSM